MPADFDIEKYLHETLAKRIMMIDGAMGTMVQKHKFVRAYQSCLNVHCI
jgi:methionine synthase I (cobalamin-dependent)